MNQSEKYQTLSVRKDDELVWIKVDRPKKLNALNDQVLTDLKQVMEDIQSQSDVRGVVISGTGDKAFVAGADINELKELNRESGEQASRKGQETFQAIEDMPVPVLALVNGYALGGGAELAMACHLRIASEKAVFGQPEVGLGLIPGYGGTQRLPRLVGQSFALEMILTGEPIEAREAFKYGLVNRVVDDSDLTAEARGLMNAITNNAPLAIQKALKAVLKGGRQGNGDGFDREAVLFGELCQTDDANEGLSAFLEQRNANFKGE